MRKALLPGIFVLLFSTFAAAQTQNLILPVVLNGSAVPPTHYQTTVRILNMGTSSVSVTLEAFQNDGTAVRVLDLAAAPDAGTKSVIPIDAGGSVEVFTAEDVPPLNGWIRLTYDARANIQATAEASVIKAPVGPDPVYMRASTDLLTSVQIPGMSASTRLSGFAVIRPYRQSAFAIVNPSTTQTANVFLSLMDLSGKLVASGIVQIAPQARVSRFVREFLPDAPQDFIGSFRITSSVAVALGGVNVLLPDGDFTGIGVTAPPSRVCAQIVVSARNPVTNECRSFGSSCDVPDGWLQTASCN